MLLLGGCASRPDPVTVHVFSNQPGHPVMERIALALDEAGFSHRISYRETPGGLEVAESVLVHPDDAAGYNHAQRVAAVVLDELGVEPEIKTRGYANHSFTGGNLGLYVFRPGAAGAPGEQVAGRYAGSCGEHSVELILFDSGRFRFELARWREDRLEHESLPAREGTWSEAEQGLILETVNGRRWTGRWQPGYGNGRLLVLDAPAEARDCRLQQPL